MDKIYITGFGALSNLGDSMGMIWESLVSGGAERRQSPYKIPDLFKHEKVRGIDPYGLLALSATQMALQNRGPITGDACRDTGTVFTSEFGNTSTNLKFLDTLYSSSAEFTSPKQFSSTVANSCLGQVCIKYGFKGPSTMLINSVNLPYACMLLYDRRAKIIVTGGLDEYQKDLFEDFDYHEDFRAGFAEGAGMLILESEFSEYLERSRILAEVISYGNAISGTVPYRHGQIPVDTELMLRVMKQVLIKADIRVEDIDAVFMISNSSKRIIQMETDAIDRLGNGKILKTAINSISGTSFSAANNINLALAALSLRNGIMPLVCNENEVSIIRKDCRYVLVNNMSIDGQWSSVLLGKES